MRILRTFFPHAPSVGSRVRITSRFPSLRRRSASTSLWNVVPAPSGPSKTMKRPRILRWMLHYFRYFPPVSMSENPKKPSSSINDRVLGDDELAEFLGEYQPRSEERRVGKECRS